MFLQKGSFCRTAERPSYLPWSKSFPSYCKGHFCLQSFVFVFVFLAVGMFITFLNCHSSGAFLLWIMKLFHSELYLQPASSCKYCYSQIRCVSCWNLVSLCSLYLQWETGWIFANLHRVIIWGWVYIISRCTSLSVFSKNWELDLSLTKDNFLQL